MKTFKIIVMLLLVSGFAINNANSQKVEKEVFEYWYDLAFPCMDQTLSGWLTVERTKRDNHLQVRHSGTLTGSSDGLEYYAEMMTNITPGLDNVRWDELDQKAITLTWPGNYHIYREGKLIAIIHFAFHYTVNANGDYTTYHGYVYECNLVGEGRIK
ncbi:MAG: hypothetical protein JXR67_03560 [Bacteroidales bacterium]|nr:hypothetical protein [Bacteroidales bacterium]